MKRRKFIAGLGSAAAWPVVARPQQTAMPVIGFLNGGSPPSAPYAAAFLQGLKEAGFVEGQNVAVEYRWADGQYDRLPAMAAELVRRQPAVIVANTFGALAAKVATTTIPIVFTTSSDPVQIGLVASLSRPGGNVMGATSLGLEVAPKRLELLRDLLPMATIIAVLVNPTNPDTESRLRDLQAAARTLGLQLAVLGAIRQLCDRLSDGCKSAPPRHRHRRIRCRRIGRSRPAALRLGLVAAWRRTHIMLIGWCAGRKCS